MLGLGWGFFIYGYWFTDIFPDGSRWVYFFTLVSTLLGILGYFFILRWVSPRLKDLSPTQKAGLVGASILIGTFLFFATTDRWELTPRYAPFFLPTHSLKISVPPTHDNSYISINWFNTSLGDVSYTAIEFNGWKREKDQLILTDPYRNQIRWSGKTGEKFQIVFQSSSNMREVHIAWDGKEESLNLSGRKNIYTHSFEVPYFASRTWILFLGVINFVFLTFPVCLFIWKRRSNTLQIFKSTLSDVSNRLDGREWVLITATVILALLLRAPNLENLFPGVDEYYQLGAAKQIVQGVPMGDVYQRSLWTVTLPVSFMFRVFGYKLWAARLTGVVFNVLAIIPLYFVIRKINRPIAAISMVLYATSPWVITFARLMREYAYYPFYFYWILYFMILFLERFPDQFRIANGWKTLLHPSVLLPGLVLVLPPIYSLYIDPLSTSKLILIAYPMLAIFVITKMDLRDGKTLLAVLLSAAILIMGTCSLLRHLSLTLTFSSVPLHYFFSNPPQQWYFNRFALLPMIGFVGAIVVCYLMRHTNSIPLFIFLLYSGFLGFFVFSSNRFEATRHLSTTNLWYIIFVAVGLYLVWTFLQTFPLFKNRNINLLAVIVLGMSSINIQQSLIPVVSNDPNMPISKDYHYQMGDLQTFMLANVRDGDVLICTVYDLYATWMGKPQFQAIHRFGAETSKEEVFSFVNQHDSGWIVIDKIILKMMKYSPFETFSETNGIRYVGLFEDQYVWRWDRGSSYQPTQQVETTQGTIE